MRSSTWEVERVSSVTGQPGACRTVILPMRVSSGQLSMVAQPASSKPSKCRRIVNGDVARAQIGEHAVLALLLAELAGLAGPRHLGWLGVVTQATDVDPLGTAALQVASEYVERDERDRGVGGHAAGIGDEGPDLGGREGPDRVVARRLPDELSAPHREPRDPDRGRDADRQPVRHSTERDASSGEERDAVDGHRGRGPRG